MKQKLNLYTILIVSYSLVVCTYFHSNQGIDRKKSPFFSTTPINHNRSNIYKEVKPTFTKAKVVSGKELKSDIS